MRVTVTPVSRPVDAFSLVDGSPLNGRPIHGETFGLEKNGLVGWKEGVAPRFESLDIPGGDGSYIPDEVYLASRVLTIRGFYNAGVDASTLGVARFEDRVASLVGEWLRVDVVDSAGPRCVEGFVSAIPVHERVSERTFKFTLVILCPDPLKYGQVAWFPVSNGRVIVENNGTGRVFPRFEVVGRVRLLDARIGRFRVRWVGDADGLSLDFRDGLPLSGGVETGSLVDAGLFRIPRGSHEISVTSDATVKVGVASGWK